jgi:DNA-binding CsgD family transcriptional regulator
LDLKKLIFTGLFILTALILTAERSSLTSERSWAYCSEILNLELNIPLSPSEESVEAELYARRGAFTLLKDDHSRMVRQISGSGKTEVSALRRYSIVPRQEGDLELACRIRRNDGRMEESNSFNLVIDALPFREGESMALLRPFTTRIIQGLPADFLLEIFADDGLVAETEYILRQSHSDEICRVESSMERQLLIEGHHYPLQTIPFRAVFRDISDRSFLFPKSLFLSREGASLSLQQPALNILPDPYGGERLIRSESLRAESLFFPSSIIPGQEQHFFLTLFADGNFTPESIAPFLDLPPQWQERQNKRRLLWRDDHSLWETEFVLYGSFAEEGYDFKTLNIPYADREGKEREESLFLGRVGKSSIGYILRRSLFGIGISLLLLGVGVLYLLFRKRKGVVREKMNRNFGEITSCKLKQFSSRFKLTKREQDILEVLAHGKSTKEISEDLFISPETTKKHIKNIMRKTEVNSRLEILVKLASE